MEKSKNRTYSVSMMLLMWVVGKIIFHVLNRIKVFGRENLNGRGNVLFISNHFTLIDPFLICPNVTSFWQFAFNGRLAPWSAAARENFFDRRARRFFFSRMKCIPVDRNLRTESAINNQVKQYVEALADSSLLIFFEGTRSRDGKIGECKIGVPKTILAANPKIIPIKLVGVQPIMPISFGSKVKIRGIRFGHRGQMIIGKPISSEEIINRCFDEDRAKFEKNIGIFIRNVVDELHA